MAQIKTWIVVGAICFILPSLSYADWLDDYLRTKFPEATHSLTPPVPTLEKWVHDIVIEMENEINRDLSSRPDRPVLKKLKSIRFYPSTGQEQSPCVISSPDKPEYSILIGTDFLRRAFQGRDTKEALLLLMGTIAHEMGHLATTHQHTLFNSQDIELEADRIAISLLRKVNLPTAAVIKVMNFLADEFGREASTELTTDSVLDSVASFIFHSHPQGEFRKSVARVRTVLDTFHFGQNTLRPFPITATLNEELRSFPANPSRPESLEDAATRLEAILAHSAELQRLIRENTRKAPRSERSAFGYEIPSSKPTFSDDFLARTCSYFDIPTLTHWLIVHAARDEKRAPLTPEQTERFNTVMTQAWGLPFLNSSLHGLYKLQEECKNKSTLSTPYSDELSASGKSLSLLRNPEILRLTERRPEPGLDDLLSHEQAAFRNSVFDILPESVIAQQVFQECFPHRWNNLKYFKGLDRGLYSESLGDHLFSEMGARLREGYSIDDLINDGLHHFNFLNWTQSDSHWNRLTPLQKENVRFLAQQIWDKKGTLAASHIPWHTLIKILELDPTEAKRQLKETVLQEVARDNPSLIATLNQAPYFGLSHSVAEDEPNQWGGPELYSALESKIKLQYLRTWMPTEYMRARVKDLWDKVPLGGDPNAWVPQAYAFLEKSLASNSSVASYEKYDDFQLFMAPFPATYSEAHPPDFIAKTGKRDFWGVFLEDLKNRRDFTDLQKREILTGLLDQPNIKGAFPHSFSPDLPHAVSALNQYQVFPSFRELFTWVGNFGKWRWVRSASLPSGESLATHLCRHQRSFLSVMDSAVKEHLDQVLAQSTSTPTFVLEEMTHYLDPEFPLPSYKKLSQSSSSKQFPGFHRCMQSNDQLLRETKKRLVEWLSPQMETPEQVIQNFRLLTLTGATEHTDHYLKKKLPILKQHPDYIRWIEQDMVSEFGKKTIYSDQLRAKVLEDWLDPQIQASLVPVEHPSEYTFNSPPPISAELVRLILKQLPKKSLARDQLIDKVLWKDERLVPDPYRNPHYLLSSARIEGGDVLKNRSDSFLLSGLVEFLCVQSPARRVPWIYYIQNPNSANYQIVLSELKKVDAETDSHRVLKREKDLENLHLEMLETSPDERLPALELVLACRNKPLPSVFESPDLLNPVLENLTGIHPDTKQSRLLNTYLRSIEPHERPLALSYLLLHQGEDSESPQLKPIFEVFSTVGIKIGQLASLFDTFQNQQAKEELESLKDHATPIDKLEFMKALSPLIKKAARIRLLGSASLKTVAEVTWKDGTRSAVMVRRPYAIPRIRENLERTQRFLAELKRLPEFREQANTLQMLQRVVEKELEEEVDFAKEQEFTRMARACRAGEEFKRMGDWTFHIPQPVELEESGAGAGAGAGTGDRSSVETDETRLAIMSMEMADGISPKKVADPALRHQVGNLIVKDWLETVFTTGNANADPHSGNYLVDVPKRVIHAIDFGQEEQLSLNLGWKTPDERTELAQFLISVQARDASAFTRSMQHFFSPPASAEGLEKLRTHFRENRDTISVQEIIHRAHELGLHFSKRHFGILKGLAILQKEHYVPETEFSSLVAEAIGQVLKAKPFIHMSIIQDTLSRCMERTTDSIERFLAPMKRRCFEAPYNVPATNFF